MYVLEALILVSFYTRIRGHFDLATEGHAVSVTVTWCTFTVL